MSRRILSWVFLGIVSTASAQCQPNKVFEQCQTDVHFCEVPHSDRCKKMHNKGVTIDDTTMQWCSEAVPKIWPNTHNPLRSIRVFQAWSGRWSKYALKKQAWVNIASFANTYGVKVLIGTPITCDAAADEESWGWTKQFLRMLNKDSIMGLAIGNELELLYAHKKEIPHSCIVELWDKKRYWKTFERFVTEFDALGYSDVPVTGVFTSQILEGNPFENIPGQALVQDFLLSATRKYGSRYAFTFNIYPYFDPNLKMNSEYKLPGGKNNCSHALHLATCWDSEKCLTTGTMLRARDKMQRLTGMVNSKFWIGEIGWSSPKAQALDTEMNECAVWSTRKAFEMFYSGFINWDMSVPGHQPVDHAFYFTLRNAMNFAVQEYFGLMNTCSDLGCKIAKPGFSSERCSTLGASAWRPYVFGGVFVTFICVIFSTCLYVRSQSVRKCVDKWDVPDDASGPESEQSSDSE